ncbi:CapA family protein [Gracilibacillus salinarum]|uniref:CapA family protein n=1 Tax=Gracilibacillus salinarum TaxID=2932255 RepID=A0ABY4GSC2_9BACI|nr:CapA family protein [Gracilibacillus salinarum]UOQ87048.1 CapA family protein [Gracilibacillus salinarum]
MVDIFVCGDIVNYQHKDGYFISEPLRDIIAGANFSIANFEAPIQGNFGPAEKSGIQHHQCKNTIAALKDQGFDMLTLANNHIMDYGEEGLKATLNEIKANELRNIGAGTSFSEAYTPQIVKINNITIGFINACEAQFGVLDYNSSDKSGYAWINHNEIDEKIIELRNICDYVVVLAHAGLENFSIPQQEWRMRYKQFINLGADVVIGSHPHVPQGFEEYKGKFIFYSLGNFYFDSKNYVNKEDNSYSVLLKLEKELSFELIYHHKEDGQVLLSQDDQKINIHDLNRQLEDNYVSELDKISLSVFNKKIKKNLVYSLSIGIYDGGILSSLKRIIRIIIGREKRHNKKLLSLHLMRNETYYYVARRALELQANSKIDGDIHE